MRLSLSLLVVLAAAAPGFATSYAAPVPRDLYSPNRAFVLDINPETERHTVFAARDRSAPLWSFSAPVGHGLFLLSDDGEVVAALAWQHVKAEELPGAAGVTFWNRQGAFRAYSVIDLCPYPLKTQEVGVVGPIGDFWHTWYTDVSHDGETFTLRTTRSGYEHRFRMSDGERIEQRNDDGAGWMRVLVVGAVVFGGLTGLVLARIRKRTAAGPGEPPGGVVTEQPEGG